MYLVVALIVGACTFYYFFIKSKNNLPPGPRGWPIVGNLLSFGKKNKNPLGKWADEFGDVVHLSILNNSYIVLSDPKLVKEIFSQDAYAGRLKDGYVLNIYPDGIDRGLLRSEGETWGQLRRFTLRHLRDFGFGKNSMELLIMEEVKEVLNWMKSVEGSPIGGIKEKMTLAVVNSLWTIVSGQRLEHDDPALRELTTGFTEAVLKASESGGLIFFAPWLRNIAPKFSGYTAFRQIMDNTRLLFTNSVNDHKQTHSEEYSRDYIDVFLTEMKKKSGDPSSAFDGEEGLKNLVSVIADLFLAGSDTTSTTLDFTFIYLGSFPEVQKKLQKEIEEITGNSRFVSVADRLNMPYAESVIAEILRCSSIFPTGVPHKVLSDTKIKGFNIPKNSVVLLNANYIHYKKEIWGDPKNFRPERFLSPDGKTFKKHEALMPFSVGKRQCPGETLARDTLFLFITNIFQKFTISLETPRIVKDVECVELKESLLPTPAPYKVIFKDRQ